MRNEEWHMKQSLALWLFNAEEREADELLRSLIVALEEDQLLHLHYN
jgi:hypothetical protein